jgi:hypothetical protein
MKLSDPENCCHYEKATVFFIVRRVLYARNWSRLNQIGTNGDVIFTGACDHHVGHLKIEIGQHEWEIVSREEWLIAMTMEM